MNWKGLPMFNQRYGEKEKVTKNLFIGREKEEGYWEVFLAPETFLIRTESKKYAKIFAEKLENLVDWSQYKTLEELKYHNIESYQQYQSFFQKFNAKIKFNGMYLNTNDGSGNVIYKIMTSKGDYPVKGKLIAKGLGVHEESDKWTIDHIPNGKIISRFSTEERAIKVANVMKSMFDWSSNDAIKNIQRLPVLQEYLKQVKDEIEKGNPVPKMSDRLSMELLMLDNPTLQERRPVFEEAMKELYGMTGLTQVKDQVQKMIKGMRVQRRLEEEGIDASQGTMHMVFYGPAGTGKTQVSRIMAKILYALGYLNKYEIVETRPGDLVGEFIGQTGPKTQAKIKEAMGGVLFIDEAYNMASGSLSGTKGDFGDDIIQELLTATENNRNQFCVILAGYEAEMSAVWKKNEGLESRFPEQNRFYFHDFTPKELTVIAKNMIEKKGFLLPENSLTAIEDGIIKQSKNGAFKGNARDVRNFTEKIVDLHKVRIDEEHVEDVKTIAADTIEWASGKRARPKNKEGLRQVREQGLQKLNRLIGLSNIKEQIEELMNYLAAQQLRAERGMDVKKPVLHMVFSGPPGTGKTTVAQYMGEILKGTGMLDNGHFMMVTRNDLEKDFERIVTKAKGGILFIDEAYALCGDKRGQEIVDELIQVMENNRDNLVVILAGYKQHMEQLLKMNPGFPSRVGYHFDFPYYSQEEMVKLVQLELRNNHLRENEQGLNMINSIIQSIFQQKGKVDDNGRWARNLVDKIRIKQGNRIIKENAENLDEVTAEDAEKGYYAM